MTSLYIFQLVMLSLLSIKRFVFAPLLVPLLVLTLMYHSSAMALFRRPWETLRWGVGAVGVGFGCWGLGWGCLGCGEGCLRLDGLQVC